MTPDQYPPDTPMATPRSEGWLAGFLGQDRDGNPYLRGFARLWPSKWVIEWDEGYDEGAAIRAAVSRLNGRWIALAPSVVILPHAPIKLALGLPCGLVPIWQSAMAAPLAKSGFIPWAWKNLSACLARLCRYLRVIDATPYWVFLPQIVVCLAYPWLAVALLGFLLVIDH